MGPRKNGRATLIAGLLGVALAAGAGFRTIERTASCCSSETPPGGANERLITGALPLAAPPRRPDLDAIFALDPPGGRDTGALPVAGDRPGEKAKEKSQKEKVPDRTFFLLPFSLCLPFASSGSPASAAPGDPNAAALDDLRAAAAGRLSIDDTGAAIHRPPSPAPPARSPGTPLPADPARPLAALPPPGPPALLAAVFLPVPAVLRRRGRQLAAALAERANNALGLLLLIAWGALHRRG